MAVRDLLWGCPLCRAPGGIRPQGRRERCRSCGAAFRRGAGANIVAVPPGGSRQERPAAEWLRLLGPLQPPAPSEDGLILGPEPVRIKFTRRQKPLRFGPRLLGWVEIYDPPQKGTLELRDDGLHFQPARGASVHWQPADLTGLQPASSSLQLGIHREMSSVKFLEGSVRLWTRALSDLLRDWHQRQGREILELQPCVRTCPMTANRP